MERNNKSLLQMVFSTGFSDTGILILRLVIGSCFVIHGYPKIMDGPEKWAMIGGAMKNVGIDFAPAFWGFCAAASEFFGGMALIVGLLTRVAASGIAFTMLIATVMHVTHGDGFEKFSHPLELMTVGVLLILSGVGKWSLDNLVFKKLEP